MNRAYDRAESGTAGNNVVGMRTARQNKGMKLTKLSAAWLQEWTCRLMPTLVDGMDAGTASQLIPGVRPTCGGASTWKPTRAWTRRIA